MMNKFQDRDTTKTKLRDRVWICSVINLLLIVSWSNHALAQIVPEATLPNPPAVIDRDSRFTIEGGTTIGSSLFHRFQEFSLLTDSEAFFNNAISIQKFKQSLKLKSKPSPWNSFLYENQTFFYKKQGLPLANTTINSHLLLRR